MSNLSLEKLAVLTQQAQRDGDSATFNRRYEQLVKRLHPLMAKFANKYAYRDNPHNEYDDYYQEAHLGLLRALKDWQPERAPDFRYYVGQQFRWRLNTYRVEQRGPHRIPFHVNRAINIYHRMRKAIDLYGLPWDTAETYDYPGQPETIIKFKDEIIKAVTTYRTLHPDASRQTLYENMMRRVRASLANAENMASNAEETTEIDVSLPFIRRRIEQHFSHRDRAIIILWSYGYAMRQIADALYEQNLTKHVITRQRISQLIPRLLTQLHDLFNNDETEQDHGHST